MTIAELHVFEHLTAWETPQYYAGFDPVGDYCILARIRDDSVINESNWQVATERMFDARWFDARPYEDDFEGKWENRPEVYMWRAGSSLIGWIEYLMVRKDASYEVLKEAEEMVCALDAYPILDESMYSEMESEAVEEYWKHCGMRERIEYCAEAGESIFAARDDYPNSKVCSLLRDYGIGD